MHINIKSRFCLRAVLTVFALASWAMGEDVRRINFGLAPVPDGEMQAPFQAETQNPIRIMERHVDFAAMRASTTHGFLRKQVMSDGHEYAKLRLPGLSIPAAVGSPNRPSREELIRIEPGATIELHIDRVKWHDFEEDVKLAPAQPPLPDYSALPGEPDHLPGFVVDENAYNRDAFDDHTPVRLIGRVKIRDQEFARIVYDPVSYNPARKRMRIAFQVDFRLQQQLPPLMDSERFDPLSAPTPEMFDARPDGLEMMLSPAPDFNVEPDTVNSAADADYLIITADAFADAVQPLADWKHRKGYRSYVATLTEVGASTTAAVKTFIQNAYDNGRPTQFVLLVGDHQDLPGVRFDDHPLEGDNTPFYSDFPYACVAGDDLYPDITVGRFPGNTVEQIAAMVEKSLSYDRNPDPNNRYDHAVIAGMFQDDNGDFRSNRWFMEGLHRAADFLGPDYGYHNPSTTKGYTIHTAFRWVTDYSDTKTVFDPMEHTVHYNDTWWYGDGRLPPPDPVPEAWKILGNKTHSAITAATIPATAAGI